MSVPSATRRLVSELNSLLDKEVIIKLKNGNHVRGKLYGFDVNTFNVLLKNASDSETTYPVMLVYHDSIVSLSAVEAPLFDPEEFARVVSSKLSIRESDIKVLPEAGIVVILNSIRVSEKGVEGSGPLAHKVYGLFTEYIESKKREVAQG